MRTPSCPVGEPPVPSIIARVTLCPRYLRRSSHCPNFLALYSRATLRMSSMRLRSRAPSDESARSARNAATLALAASAGRGARDRPMLVVDVRGVPSASGVGEGPRAVHIVQEGSAAQGANCSRRRDARRGQVEGRNSLQLTAGDCDNVAAAGGKRGGGVLAKHAGFEKHVRRGECLSRMARKKLPLIPTPALKPVGDLFGAHQLSLVTRGTAASRWRKSDQGARGGGEGGGGDGGGETGVPETTATTTPRRARASFIDDCVG